MVRTILAIEPALLAVIALCLLLGLGLLYASWRGLRGDWRSWAVPRGLIDFRSRFGIYPNFPFKAAAGGVFFLAFAAHTALDRTSSVPENYLQPLLALMSAAPFIGMAAAFWWPALLGPGWYRQWRREGARGRALPYGEAEIAAANGMAAGPRRERVLRDLEKCRMIRSGAGK